MKPIEAMGAALYWAEGTKIRVDKRGWTQYGPMLTNTDPELIKAYLIFLRSIGICETKLRVQLTLYPEHIKNKEIKFWSNTTGIPRKQFTEITLASGSGKRKKSLHGICQVRYFNKDIHLKIEKMISLLKQGFHDSKKL
jgi:hypothetical protein